MAKLLIALCLSLAALTGCKTLDLEDPCKLDQSALLPEERGACYHAAVVEAMEAAAEIANYPSTNAEVANAINKVLAAMGEPMNAFAGAILELTDVRKELAAGTTTEEQLQIAVSILEDKKAAVQKLNTELEEAK